VGGRVEAIGDEGGYVVAGGAVSAPLASVGEAEFGPAIEAVFGAQSEAIRAYVGRLASTGVEWGLLGPAEADRLWSRHIFNSVAVSDLIGEGAAVFDVGSGAGLPGIPLALRRPDLTVTLIEPLLRRSEFLRETVAELELGDRVSVVRGRAAEVRATADVVVARAVAPLGRLVEETVHLFGSGGLLAIKGERAETEMAAASTVLRRLGLVATLVQVAAHPTVELARVVRVNAAA
jgi:16S rRNA (guanine527-N7)-methyltransferase